MENPNQSWGFINSKQFKTDQSHGTSGGLRTGKPGLSGHALSKLAIEETIHTGQATVMASVADFLGKIWGKCGRRDEKSKPLVEHLG